VRRLLKVFVRRYKELGGELRLRSGVRQIVVRDGTAQRLVLDDGSELEARRILSSAGWSETMRLCDGPRPASAASAPRISFVESTSVLDCRPGDLGCDRTIVFFNDSERFRYLVPDEPVDVRSGVICCPDNFAYPEPVPPEGPVRISMLANHGRWAALDEGEYRLAKRGWYDKMVASAVRFVPDFRGRVVDSDIFTPATIERYTGHHEGAVYGSPAKSYDGTTQLGNLFLCGNDQGLVGIVGAVLSGITMANKHLLK
jgi:phytoene dehydrogenase-like protein